MSHAPSPGCSAFSLETQWSAVHALDGAAASRSLPASGLHKTGLCLQTLLLQVTRGAAAVGTGAFILSRGRGSAGSEPCVSSFQTLLENPTLFHDVCGAAAPGDGMTACCQGWMCIRGSPPLAPPPPSGRLLTLFIIFFPFLSVPCLRPSRHLRLHSSRFPAAASDRPVARTPGQHPRPAWGPLR